MANIIEITDLEHPALAPYFKLTGNDEIVFYQIISQAQELAFQCDEQKFDHTGYRKKQIWKLFPRNWTHDPIPFPLHGQIIPLFRQPMLFS